MKVVSLFARIVFAALLVTAASSQSAYAAAKAPKPKLKPGVVLKNEGYYVVIDTKDKVQITKTRAGGELAAKTKGYIPAEQYFSSKVSCAPQAPSGIYVLQPGETKSFSFALDFNLGTTDKTVTSKFNLQKGSYKVHGKCTGFGGVHVYAYEMGSINANPEDVDVFDIKENKSGVYFELSGTYKGNCSSGTIDLTRLN